MHNNDVISCDIASSYLLWLCKSTLIWAVPLLLICLHPLLCSVAIIWMCGRSFTVYILLPHEHFTACGPVVCGTHVTGVHLLTVMSLSLSPCSRATTRPWIGGQWVYWSTRCQLATLPSLPTSLFRYMRRLSQERSVDLYFAGLIFTNSCFLTFVGNNFTNSTLLNDYATHCKIFSEIIFFFFFFFFENEYYTLCTK